MAMPSFTNLNNLFSDPRFWIIATGLFEAFIFAHTPAVFQSYDYVLRENDYFQDQNHTKTDEDLSKTYGQLYTLVTLTASVSMFATGIITDMFGFWYARFYLHTVCFIGLVSLTFMSLYHVDWLAWIGVPFFVGNSHAFTRMYNFQCKIYPEKTTFLMALQFVPITMAQLMYIPYTRMSQQAYFYIAILACLPYSIARTFIYCPKRNIYDAQGQMRFGLETRHDPPLKREEVTSDTSKVENTTPSDSIPFWKVLIQPIYLFLYPAFIIIYIRLGIFIACYQSWIRFKAKDYDNPDEIVSSFTAFYSIFQFSGALTIPLIGLGFDFLGKFLVSKFNWPLQKSTAAVGILMLFFDCGIFFAIDFMSLIPGIGAQTYVILFIVVTVQGSLYSARTLFIYGTSSQNLHGRILAVTNVMLFSAGLTTPLFPTLVNETFDGNWDTLSYVFIAAMIVAVICLTLLSILWYFKFEYKVVPKSEDDKVRKLGMPPTYFDNQGVEYYGKDKRFIDF